MESSASNLKADVIELKINGPTQGVITVLQEVKKQTNDAVAVLEMKLLSNVKTQNERGVR